MAYGDSEARGVGGWLALLVFGLMVGSPLFALGGTASELRSAENSYPQLTEMAAWQSAKTATWAFAFLQAIMSFFAGWRLVRKFLPSTVTYVTSVLWVAGPGINIVSALVISSILSAPAGPAIAASGQSFIYAIIWSAYLAKSRRVENTYYAHIMAKSRSKRHFRMPRIALKRWNPDRRKAAFVAISWAVVALVYGLLFDAEYDGFFADGSDRDWSKLAIWVFVPPLLYLAGRLVYGRFVAPSEQDTK